MNQDQKQHIERLYSRAIELRDRTKTDIGETMETLAELGENVAGIVNKHWFKDEFQSCDWSIFKVSTKIHRAKRKGLTYNPQQLLLSFSDKEVDAEGDDAEENAEPKVNNSDFRRNRFYKDCERIIIYLAERKAEAHPRTWPEWERNAFAMQLRAIEKAGIGIVNEGF